MKTRDTAAFYWWKSNLTKAKNNGCVGLVNGRRLLSGGGRRTSPLLCDCTLVRLIFGVDISSKYSKKYRKEFSSEAYSYEHKYKSNSEQLVVRYRIGEQIKQKYKTYK